MRKRGRQTDNAAGRCPECGVPLRVGDKRCEFCGRKVEPDVAAVRAERSGAGAPGAFGKLLAGRGGDLLKALGIAALAAGTLAFGALAVRTRQPETAPGRVLTGDREAAYRACQDHIRQLAGASLAVKAFLSGTVAEAKGGYSVSGTVELQPAAGDAVRKRYSCATRRDPKTGSVVVEGRIQ